MSSINLKTLTIYILMYIYYPPNPRPFQKFVFHSDINIPLRTLVMYHVYQDILLFYFKYTVYYVYMTKWWRQRWIKILEYICPENMVYVKLEYSLYKLYNLHDRCKIWDGSGRFYADDFILQSVFRPFNKKIEN